MVSDIRLPPPILPLSPTNSTLYSMYNSQKIHPNVLCSVNKENSVYITNPCIAQKTYSYNTNHNAYLESGSNILKSNRYDSVNNNVYDRHTNTLVNMANVRSSYFKPVGQNRYLRNIVNQNLVAKVLEEETKNRIRSSSVPPYSNYNNNNMFGFDNSAFAVSHKRQIKRCDSPMYSFKKTEPIIEQYLGHV